MTQVYQDTDKHTTLKVPVALAKRLRIRSIETERQLQEITAEAISDWLVKSAATSPSLQETSVGKQG